MMNHHLAGALGLEDANAGFGSRPSTSSFSGSRTSPASSGGKCWKNALEACRPGDEVVVRCERREQAVAISVHNPGVIPRPVQLQIFQRSFSTKGGEGRGVGTYSVRLFVEQYLRGSVRFESTEAAGTIFELTLPGTLEPRTAA